MILVPTSTHFKGNVIGYQIILNVFSYYINLTWTFY